MSDYAVAEYVKGLINGLDGGPAGIFEAHVSGPPQDLQTVASPPRAFIWPNLFTEIHATMGGSTAMRDSTGSPLVIELRKVYSPDDTNLDKWLYAVEQVKGKLRTISHVYLDADGNPVARSEANSTLLALSERMSSRYPRLAIPSRMQFTARATVECSVKEQVTAVYSDAQVGEPVRALDAVITELGGNHTYTVNFPIPAGAVLDDAPITYIAKWGASGGAALHAGDADNAFGYWAAAALASINPGSAIVSDTLLGGNLFSNASPGAYASGSPFFGKVYPTGGTVTFVVSATDAGAHTTGRTRVGVRYHLPLEQPITVAVT